MQLGPTPVDLRHRHRQPELMDAPELPPARFIETPAIARKFERKCRTGTTPAYDDGASPMGLESGRALPANQDNSFIREPSNSSNSGAT
jgi:hypothetical protein